MNNKTEKIFSEIQKSMEGKDFKNEEQAKEFVDKFIQNYNQNLEKNTKMDEYDFLEKAQNAATDSEAIKYARKALKLNPYCLDAELIIAESKAENIDVLVKEVKKIIQKGEEQLKERGIKMEEDAGSFYGILETRPYMRVRNEYLQLLLEQGKFRSAIGEAEEMIRLCENDNLGVRYTLMALYCYYEDEKKAMELFHKYPEDTTFMLLPLIALYYKMDDVKKMRKYIRKLANRNPELQEAMEIMLNPDDNGKNDKLLDIMSSEMYRPFSKEEFILAFSESFYLYMPMKHFLGSLYAEVTS